MHCHAQPSARGAEIRQGRAVGLQTVGDRVTGVILEDGELACDAVVIASGPWSAQAGEWLGFNIPVEPYKGEILRLRIDSAMPPYDFSGGGANLHIRADGLLWAGATEERKGFDRQPSEYARRTLMKGATKLMPFLEDAEIARHTACLRPFDARLAAYSRRGAWVGQCLPRHRRRQERHPARSRYRQRRSGYNHRRRHESAGGGI